MAGDVSAGAFYVDGRIPRAFFRVSNEGAGGIAIHAFSRSGAFCHGNGAAFLRLLKNFYVYALINAPFAR